jgi:hypothetical protein
MTSRTSFLALGATLGATLAACARPEPRPDAPAGTPAGAPAAAVAAGAADSIALERGACFGSCPTYRVVIGADGRIAFASRGRDRSTHATADGAAGAVAELARRAEAAGFFDLPEDVTADRALCRDRATDMPTATVTIYRASGIKRVVDYRGCAPEPAAEPRLERLRALQAAVDSAAGSQRWARPADRS